MKSGDMTYKNRTVKDLIRFIRNSTDNSQLIETKRIPSYSILLGAGASVTSGIRSGQELINIWKEEVYKESGVDKYNSASEFFALDAPSWYDERNEYSSLFENRFDLQRHRRMFVENEVAGKTPSLGYAYLVKLIENGFFNTVFTTNFDDLLNEAFYRFSKNRPIVCAHDSSISGVTVTSTRPKIIKLHGDYLFDDIKATLRETESLESNMKMKFQEFAKDFGLIVIGYAGNDRSIMDILTYLLQQEEYFKNGIYWCVRKSDKETELSLSSELKKLLWRDRVFYVEIDGFDEFFADLNYELNNGSLPIDDSFLSRGHQEKILKDLTENQYLNLNDETSRLSIDCKRLNEHFESNMANDYLHFMKDKSANGTKGFSRKSATRKTGLKKMTKDEIKELNDILDQVYVLKKKKEVLNKLQGRNIFEMEDGKFKLELLELEADLITCMSDEMVKKYFDELIRLSPENEKYYEIAANRSKDIHQELDYLQRASIKFRNDPYIINRYTSSLLCYCEQYGGTADITSELDQIISKVNESLKLDPSIKNYAYCHKLEYLRLKYEGSELKINSDYLCEEMRSLSEYHPNTIKVLNESRYEGLTETVLKDAIEFYLSADDQTSVEKLYIQLLNWYDKNGNFNQIKSSFAKFEKDYSPSDFYKREKARILKNYEYLEDAFNIYASLPPSIEIDKDIMTILCHLGRTDDLTSYYERNNQDGSLDDHYLSLTGQYEKLNEYYISKIESGSALTKEEAMDYSFVLLKLNKYHEVVKLLKPYYDKPQLSAGAIIVNYLYASKNLDSKKNDKYNNKIKTKILDDKFHNYTELERLGALCVIGGINDIISSLSKINKNDPFDKYSIKSWPVMKPYLENDRIAKVLMPTPKKLD